MGRFRCGISIEQNGFFHFRSSEHDGKVSLWDYIFLDLSSSEGLWHYCIQYCPCIFIIYDGDE